MTALRLLRALAVDLLTAVADACAAYVARVDRRLADRINGAEEEW